MFGNLFSKKIKRKPFTVKKQYFDSSIPDKEKVTTLNLISAFDDFIKEIEKFASGRDCSLQEKLKDEKHLDMVRAEMLVLCFRCFDSFDNSAYIAKANFDHGSIIYSVVLDYIGSLSFKFPTDNFKDSHDFFESRYPYYCHCFQFLLFGNESDLQNSLDWLLSVISIRPFRSFKPLQSDELPIDVIDFDVFNQLLFQNFFIGTFFPFLRRLDKCLLKL